MTRRVLQGPFLTRAQAARRARVPTRVLMYRPDLLRVSGDWLPEVYFEFQFDGHGVRPEVGSVVQNLKGRYADIEIADWLVQPNSSLGRATPLRFLRGGGAVERALEAAEIDGPVREEPIEVPGRVVDEVEHPVHVPAQVRRRRIRRPRIHRPVFHGR